MRDLGVSLAARASTQLVVDDVRCYRCVPDLVIPWALPGSTRRGSTSSTAGSLSGRERRGLAHDATLRRSAAKAALWCWTFGIPRRWLMVEELKAGKSGFCRHSNASRAFPPDDAHSDPDPGFPRDVYLDYVDAYYAAILSDRETATAQ